MNNPVTRINNWLKEESTSGNPFSQGAVLCTTNKTGVPHSRVISTSLDEKGFPKFHTSPTTGKVADLAINPQASLTYSFQNSLRSITIEGELSPLTDKELDNDWQNYDQDFKRHYLIFGEISGMPIDSIDNLRAIRDSLKQGEEELRPSSFIGFKFTNITQLSFYSVRNGDFAISERFIKNPKTSCWDYTLVAP